MSYGSPCSSPVQKRRGNSAMSHQNAYDVEAFRNRWIEKIDKNISDDLCHSCMDDPASLSTLSESINDSDDLEVAKIMSEFDKMQRRLEYFERESKKREFLEYFSTKTCTSDQLIFIRNNPALVSNLKDFELLSFGDSDEGSIFTHLPSTTRKMSHNPFMTTSTNSCRNSLNQSLLYRVKRLFICW